MRTRLTWTGIVLAVALLMLVSPPLPEPPVPPPAAGRVEGDNLPEASESGGTRVPTLQPKRPALDATPSAGRAQPDAGTLDEHTIVGTRWERDGVGLEFGADGILLMGGRQRARWSVVGHRVWLYRDATAEEHWLDIVGNSLLWRGQELSRVSSRH